MYQKWLKYAKFILKKSDEQIHYDGCEKSIYIKCNNQGSGGFRGCRALVSKFLLIKIILQLAFRQFSSNKPYRKTACFSQAK